MELASTQAVMARLYTDSDFRRRFFEDPVTVGGEFGLTQADSTELARVSEEKVKAFTNSLRRQRLSRVALLMPLSAKVLDRVFTECFRDYLLEKKPPADASPPDDCISFFDFIADRIRTTAIAPRWTLDLLRFELAGIRAEWKGVRFQCLVFQYPVTRMIRGIRKQHFPSSPMPIPGMALWWRWSPDRPLHSIAF